MSTEHQETTTTKLKRIAWLSSQSKDKVFHQLMPHFNLESLRHCYHELDGKKAVGIDEVTKEQYGVGLDKNLEALLARMRRMGYRPGAMREVHIPKAGSRTETRPLGISNFEDKIIQKQMQKVLESIYEPIFLDCSYGFRPGRGCHDAIRALQHHLHQEAVEVVIDLDIKNYFGSIDHSKVLSLVQHKIKDKRFLRYLARMFKAGILKAGEFTVSDQGVAQGSVCSPVIANVYAHYVLDEWFETVVKKHCRGKVSLYRYCDDAVICCQYAKDAERVHRALEKRLTKYKLKLNTEKTKLVSFSKWRYGQGKRQGSFEFLGFSFYLGKSRRGFSVPKLKTSRKSMCNKLLNLKIWLKANRSALPLNVLWERLASKLRGHFRYYGVSHNTESLNQYLHEARRLTFKWLNRRSQKRSMNWEKFKLFEARFPLPKVRIYHKLF